MSNIETLLADINQSLADMVAAAEKNATGTELASIEQALVDIAGAMEARKREPLDLRGLIQAISALKLVVTVQAPEIRPIFHVPPSAVQVVPEVFKPLTVKINRDRHTNLVESFDIQEKE